MLTWARRATTGVAAGVVVLVVTAAGASAASGAWSFSEVPAGESVPSGQSFGSLPLYAAGNTTLRAVAHGGGSALDFRNWRDLSAGQKVDPTAAMLSSDPAWETSRQGGSDGGSDEFDPGTGSLAVSVWVKPTPAVDFPRGSLAPSKISPNLVQKGKANAAGGYWKMYLKMAKRSGELVWTPACVVKGGNGVLARVNTGRNAVALDPSLGYTLSCSRIGGVMSMTITPDGGTPVTVRGDTGATMSVSNAFPVSVGHKPRTTDPTDVYDGLLDSLSVSAGQSTAAVATVQSSDTVQPGQSFGSIPVYAAGNTTLRAVAHGGGSALDFRNWRDLSAGQKVDPTAAMLSSDPAWETSSQGGSDGGSDEFDPGTGSLAVSVWVKPTPAVDFPRGSLAPSKISPNLVQKGKANAAGGYWKMYLKMAKRSGELVWTPACVVKGGNGVLARVNTGRNAVALDPSLGYTLSCSRIGGVMSMTITPDGGTPVTVRGDTGATMSVSNAFPVSVGHKPRTTDPTDVYDGLLDSLSVSAG